MSSSALTGSAFSILLNGNLVARDVINSLVAGGVASCTASLYFTNPVWAMFLGSCAGLCQAIFQRFVEKSVARKKKIINTHSFFLFGFQGLLGSAFASGFRKMIEYRNDGFAYDQDYLDLEKPGFDMAVGSLSAGMGIGFGLITGLFVFACAKHEKADHFEDFTYWVADDGIRFPRKEIDSPYEEDPGDIFIKETNVNVKAKHAYL